MRPLVEEIGHALVRRLFKQFTGGADLNQSPGAQHGDTVGQTQRFTRIVGHQQRRDAAFTHQLQEATLQVAANGRVQRAEWFVHQQDVRVGDQRPGKPDALLHAARQLVGEMLAPLCQPHRLQLPLRRCVPRTFRLTSQLQRQGNVVAYAAMRQQSEVLEHHADALRTQLAQRGQRQVAQQLAIDKHIAAAWFYQPVDVAQQGRFAAAGCTHQAKHLATPHREAHLLNRATRA